MSTGEVVGWVGALWRYPVESMLGERLQCAIVTEHGVLGDRAYALVDRLTGNVGSTKNPRKWGFLLECNARFGRPVEADAPLPPAMITLPDATCIETDQPAACELLSKALGREVKIAYGGTEKPMIEKYWPQVVGLDHHNELTHEAIVENTFFDGDPVHLLTTGSLSTLTALYPSGYFDARRFRPNIVICTPQEQRSLFENGWVGHTLAIGPQVRFHIKHPTQRCVITTLAQAELPRDLGTLKAVPRSSTPQVSGYIQQCCGRDYHRKRPGCAELIGSTGRNRGGCIVAIKMDCRPGCLDDNKAVWSGTNRLPLTTPRRFCPNNCAACELTEDGAWPSWPNALSFRRINRHCGVQWELGRLTKDEPRFDLDLRVANF